MPQCHWSHPEGKIDQYQILAKYNNGQVLCIHTGIPDYRQVSNIRRIEYQNLKVSCLVLQLSLPNLLKPCVQLRIKILLEHRRQGMLQLHLSDRQFYCQLRCAYIRDDTVGCRWLEGRKNKSIQLTHWSGNKTASILQMTFSNVVSWKKIVVQWNPL